MSHRPRRISHSRTVIPALLLAGAVLTGGEAASAQEVALRVSRLIGTESDLDGLFVSFSNGVGIAAIEVNAGRWDLRGDQNGGLYGIGADARLFRGTLGPVYLIGGVQGGFGTKDASTLWGSWSVGAGYDLFVAGPIRFGLEARYRGVSQDSRNGIEIGGRIGIGFGGGGGGGGGGPRGALSTSPAGPGPSSPRLGTVAVAGGNSASAGVVRVALDAMGTPYQWGGSSANGYDCSGLVQFAYARQGVVLPRRSADQAREGVEVSRAVDSLRQGDILTFSARGGDAVTHVGLYVGEGRFIHSGSTGVQVSLLSEADPYGAWWYSRWVGARRILE